MSSEQLTSFNLHLAKQCRPISKLSSNEDFKKISLKYSKSNGSTSSYFNSELDDDFEMDEDDENSNDTSISSENTMLYGSKFSGLLPNSSSKGVLNESSLGRPKADTRHRMNQGISKRRAANLRERKRMKSINYAFDVSRLFSILLFNCYKRLMISKFICLLQVSSERIALNPRVLTCEAQASRLFNEACFRHVSVWSGGRVLSTHSD